MEVPVKRTPGTNVVPLQRGYQQASTVDVSPIARGLDEVKRAMDAELALQREDLKKAQQFDLNKALLDERRRMIEDFSARQRDPQRSVNTFAEEIDTDYGAAHAALVERYRKEGYHPDLVSNFDVQLGGMQDNFFEQGLIYQANALGTRAVSDTNDMITMGTQAVVLNPDSYATMADFLEQSIAINPYLTDSQRTQISDGAKDALVNAGAKAFAVSRPEDTFALLDPAGIYRQQNGMGGNVTRVQAEGDRGVVANELQAGGIPPHVVAGFLGNFDVERGWDGLLGDDDSASGIAQWRLERRENFRKQYGKDPHQATKAEQAQFVLWEMQNPAEAGMTVAQRDAILAAPDAATAADLIDRYYERSSGEHREQRVANAAKYASVQAIDIPPSTASQAPALVLPDGSPAPVEQFDPTIARTGNPLLDAADGALRLQMLGWAGEQQARQNSSDKATMDLVIANVTSEALTNGEVANPIPSEQEVLRIYGPLEGPQKWAQVQQVLRVGKSIQDFITLPPVAIQAKLDQLKPVPGSPTFATEQQIYNAAQTAAAQLMDEREKDPAAYALKNFPAVAQAAGKGTAEYYAELDRAYEVLGIDPRDRAPMPQNAVEKTIEDYQTWSAAQRQDWMQENFTAMGEDRFQKFVKGMKGTTAAEDAMIYATMRQVPYGGRIFQQILNGREMIKKDPARRPSAAAATAVFREEVAPALNNIDPDVSRAINQSAEALYVYNNGDPTSLDGDINLYRESLKQVLGGSLPVDMSHGEVDDYTILPPGITRARFENWIEGLVPGKLTEMSVDKQPPVYSDLKTRVLLQDIVDEGVFVMVAPGAYMIKMGSDGRPILSPTGRPFIVNILPKDVKSRVAAPRQQPSVGISTRVLD